MAIVSLGKIVVVTAGTPVRATSTQVDPSAKILWHAILIQPAISNTGRIYIGNNQSFVKNGAGQIAWLAPPGTNVAPSFSMTVSYASNSIEVTDFWIDSDVNGEAAIISGINA